MSATLNGRILHFVCRVPDRGRTVFFFKTILGMKVLRHEEFAEGCEASCNGPYNSRWSKTMVGYGPEDTHFAIELTYNYPIRSYENGNDFIGITIKSSEVLQRAKTHDWPILTNNTLRAPGGYHFFIISEPQPTETDPVQKITLASSNLQRSIEYWNGILLLQIFSRDDANKKVVLGYKESEVKLELQEINEAVTHGTAFGRIAFSYPHNEQPMVDERNAAAKGTVLVPMRSLDTPGKATVRILVLADPDSHEICIVDDEAFRELSQYQPDDEKILNRFIKKDETGQLKLQDEKRAKAQMHAKEF